MLGRVLCILHGCCPLQGPLILAKWRCSAQAWSADLYSSAWSGQVTIKKLEQCAIQYVLLEILLYRRRRLMEWNWAPLCILWAAWRCFSILVPLVEDDGNAFTVEVELLVERAHTFEQAVLQLQTAEIAARKGLFNTGPNVSVYGVVCTQTVWKREKNSNDASAFYILQPSPIFYKHTADRLAGIDVALVLVRLMPISTSFW